MSKVTVKLNKVAVQLMLKGRGGTVQRVHAGWAGLATREVRSVAQSRVTSRTGSYVGGIRSTLRDSARGAVVVITAAAAHAAIIELGSRPHAIIGNPWLASRERNFGPVRSVFHPGTRPQNVLRDGAEKAARMYGRVGIG